MGIGTGPGVAGSSVPPQINEDRTSFAESQKMQTGLVPQNQTDNISFTQRGEELLWKYDTNSSNPSLTPLRQLRMAELSKESDNNSAAIYDGLVQKLPDAIKKELIAELEKPLTQRNSNYVALNDVLMAAATFVNWLNSASVSPAPGTPAASQNEINHEMPHTAMKTAIGILSDLPKSHISKQLSDLSLRAETEGFKQISDSAHKLLEMIKKEETLHFLTDVTHTLAIVTSSLAMEHGSPSLLFGTEIANTAQSGPFQEIGESIVSGLRNSMQFGPREELQELNFLKNSLRSL